MDGIADVDGAYPSPMLLPFELTAQIDDAALAGGIGIQAVCSQLGCSTLSGPTSAIQFSGLGGIADHINPLIQPTGTVDGANILITLYVGPIGGLAGEIRLGEDWMNGRSFDLNILSDHTDGSWSGHYQHDDAPFWTLSAPRWERVDAPIGDPVGVPEPSSNGLMTLGMCLALAFSRARPLL